MVFKLNLISNRTVNVGFHLGLWTCCVVLNQLGNVSWRIPMVCGFSSFINQAMGLLET